jgi:hypothetical protein
VNLEAYYDTTDEMRRQFRIFAAYHFAADQPTREALAARFSVTFEAVAYVLR